MPKHREIHFVKTPTGLPDSSCFRLVDAPVPQPGPGQVLARTHYLSIDPYMRRMMAGGHGYATPLQPGNLMVGRGVGIVVESRHPDFAPGDAVQSEFGWREHAVLDGTGLRLVPADLRPLSLSLGIVGQSGATAWVGLHDVGRIKAGETVVVSAAAGAVGSAVGQIAQLEGCRAVGIAGGPAKCRHVVQELGFDACIDYKAPTFQQDLGAALPGGVDIYFDNVGGEILDAALRHINVGARIPLCGLISQYNTSEPRGIGHIGALLDKSATIQGFRIGTRLDRRDAALDRLMSWFREGRLRWRETVADGLEQAPAALVNMLTGGNVGKQIVRLAAAEGRQ
ncbi:MAG: NADP-dependent oxidoreductase [Hyphomicrobiaceae bacterium]|nr:NADP-dependent oxidoreductase [Hyphomicrobiaceae bacterium]